MTKLNVPFLNCFRSRHGKALYFFRRGAVRVRLPDTFPSEEFWTAYNTAKDGAAQPESEAKRAAPGTFNAAIAAYYRSVEFRDLADSTQRARRHILERFRGEHGDKRVKLFERAHLKDLISVKAAATPGAAQELLKIMRGLMKFCIDMGLREDNPAVGIRNVKMHSSGIYSWSEEDIARYRGHYAIGTRQRLAIELLLGTGQRRGDVVRMGRQHVHEGMIDVRQQKTGKVLSIPVHPDLAEVLAATPADNLTFLITAYGAPFTAKGFGTAFRDWCNEAGMPAECSAHGLRKACCRRLAEAGCTAHEIAAISGHTTLAEIQRYTAAAAQKTLAQAAIATVVAARPGTRN